MKRIEGIFPALITPYSPSGTISEEMLRRLVETHINAGVSGLYLCGGSGEGLLLKAAERKRIAEVVVEQSRGRITVIVHVGGISTAEAIELASHAQQVGADAISSIPPFYFGVSTDAIYHHYAQIGRSCSLPMLVYNIPSAVQVTVTPKLMSKLMEIPSVIGIKFSSYNHFELWQISQLDHGRATVLSGNDEVFLAAMAMGAHGSIGLTLNFMSQIYRDIFHDFRSGRWEHARELQSYANNVIRVLLQYPVIPAAKEIMRFKGYDCGNCRGPLETLTEDQKKNLHAGLIEVGFFEKKLGL